MWVQSLGPGSGCGCIPRNLPSLLSTSRARGARAPPPSRRRARSTRGAWRPWHRPATEATLSLPTGAATRGTRGAATHVERDERQGASQRELLEIQLPIHGLHLPVLLGQPRQPGGCEARLSPPAAACPPPSRRFPRVSPEAGVALDGRTARGPLIAAVQAQGGPAAVHEQLPAVGVVADDPGEDTDRHLLGPAGAQLGLLQVCGAAPGLSRGLSRPRGSPPGPHSP